MRLLLSVVGDLGFQGMHPGRLVYQLSDSKDRWWMLWALGLAVTSV